MADEVHTEAHGEVAEPQERLDPETRARREAALKLVRKYGDPVLRSRALEIDRFDDALVEEVRRMGRLMHDAYGIGLAATQVGVMHRVLVYRTELEGSVAALVNPVLEWSSKDKETSEEGCLSLPGVSVEVERPVHVRVRALDERGAPILVEASGLEARVIQHEMDHLDGVLILDRTSRDQRKQAMRALREALEPRTGRGVRAQRLPRHLGVRGRRAAAAGRRPTTARSSSSRAPTRKQGRGQKLAPPPVAVLARELGIEVIQPEQLHAPEVLARIAAAEPEVLTTCAYGVLIKEPLLSDYEMINVHPSLLPRWRGAAPIERAIMAGDAETGVAIMRVTAGWDSGAGLRARRREPIRARRRLRHARRRGWRRSAPTCWCKALDERPAPVEQDESLVTYAHKIGPRERALDPTQTPAGGRAHDPRAAPAHRLAPAAARRDLPRRDRRPRRRPDPRARRRPRPHRGRAAAARLPRRRARADRGAAAGRAPDGRRRLAARPPRRRRWSTSASTPRCPTATSPRCSARARAEWARRGRRVAAARVRARRARQPRGARRDGRARRATPDPRARELAAYVLGQLGTAAPALPAEQEAALRAMAAREQDPRGAGRDRLRVRPPRRAARPGLAARPARARRTPTCARRSRSRSAAAPATTRSPR